MDISLILLFSSLADLLWAEAEVTGVVGRAIRINCRYDEQKYSGHTKYWCRGYYLSSCEDVIDTKAVNGQRGRFSITDKRDGVFTVTMENLTMRDAGWYNCGIDQFGRDTMVAVKVHISDGTEFSSPKITTKSMPTAHVPAARISFMVTQATIMATKGQQHSYTLWSWLRWVLFAVLLISLISAIYCSKKRHAEPEQHHKILTGHPTWSVRNPDHVDLQCL
ncbi:CMRF35-like molecule 2 [Callorhinchus milii]|uniref:CMRF35-like molecule 2 n=1 Tax=Callorhinchus milii TaxID=7868 RepID=UPI001C3FBB1B|nr:CMRF35-like molecule 2 [Callorhinchus milii]